MACSLLSGIGGCAAGRRAPSAASDLQDSGAGELAPRLASPSAFSGAVGSAALLPELVLHVQPLPVLQVSPHCWLHVSPLSKHLALVCSRWLQQHGHSGCQAQHGSRAAPTTHLDAG